MYNYDQRKDTSLLLQYKPQSSPYKPIRKQGSTNKQCSHHDIFGTQSPFTRKYQEVDSSHYSKRITPEKQKNDTTFNKSPALVKSSTKVGYAQKQNDIFNDQIQNDYQRVRVTDTFKSTVLKENKETQKITQRQPYRDHSKEFLMHCSNESPQQKQQKSDFVPQFIEESPMQKRERDFVNGAINEVLPLENRYEMKRSFSKSETKKQDQSSSNIFFLQEKDVELPKNQSKNDIAPTYGKSNQIPWLSINQETKGTNVNEFVNFQQNYAKERKLEGLRSSLDNFVRQKEQYQEDEAVLQDLEKSHNRSKTDLISSAMKWNNFDSQVHGRSNLAEKNIYPQPVTRPFSKKEVTEQSVTRKRCDSQVEVCRWNLEGPMNENEIRKICRQNDCHLVEISCRVNPITNQIGELKKCTIRTSYSPDQSTQQIQNLRESLNRLGIKASEQEEQHQIKSSKSNLYLQQEQQTKQLEELERYYNQQQINVPKKQKPSQIKKPFKSKYSHQY